ncbi:MAG: hypothetical protein P8013_09910 [Candidatus Sulfobium sp.]|jgi:hypothetical protein
MMLESILLGVTGSLVASILFLIFASLFRPNLTLSKNISVGEYDGKQIFSVKVANCGCRSAINIRVELQIIGTRVVEGGKGKKIYDVELLKNDHLILKPYSKNNPINCSFEFSTVANLPEEWKKIEESNLLFRVIAQDSFTSFCKVFEQEYYSPASAIKQGRFGFGKNLTIYS